MSFEFFPRNELIKILTDKVLEQPGLPVKNNGISFITQLYIKNIFSFRALFLAIFLSGFILDIKSSYSLFITSYIYLQSISIISDIYSIYYYLIFS